MRTSDQKRAPFRSAGTCTSLLAGSRSSFFLVLARSDIVASVHALPLSLPLPVKRGLVLYHPSAFCLGFSHESLSGSPRPRSRTPPADRYSRAALFRHRSLSSPRGWLRFASLSLLASSSSPSRHGYRAACLPSTSRPSARDFTLGSVCRTLVERKRMRRKR